MEHGYCSASPPPQSAWGLRPCPWPPQGPQQQGLELRPSSAPSLPCPDCLKLVSCPHAFTRRVAFEEGSGPRVLLKSEQGNRGRSYPVDSKLCPTKLLQWCWDLSAKETVLVNRRKTIHEAGRRSLGGTESQCGRRGKCRRGSGGRAAEEGRGQ